MKLRKILLGEHYKQYWKQGTVLPDSYPPDHPSAPCYRCNRLVKCCFDWTERLVHVCLFPGRRHRNRLLLPFGFLFMFLMVLRQTQYPMIISSRPMHTRDVTWKDRLLAGILGTNKRSQRPIKRNLVQDWVIAPNCDAIVKGDPEEIHFTKRMMYHAIREHVTDQDYFHHTKNCTQFRASEQFATQPMSEEEANFPLAFLIQGYKNAEQLQRLLRAIYAPHNPYCICTNHKASPDFHKSMRSISNCFKNVFHVSSLKYNKTKNHVASEVDDIKCARKCMKVLLNANWKYLIKIHGQDYPLVSNQLIVSKLKALERLHSPFISDYSHLQKKQTVQVVLSNNSLGEVEKLDVTLWRGSPFFIASKSIITKLLNTSLTYNLLPAIQHHEHSEAYYWSTIILYLIGDANHAAMVAANTHRIELQAHKKLRTKQYCAGITQLQDHCVYKMEDLNKIFHSRHNQFFVHGFDLDKDHVAFSCTEQHLDSTLNDYALNLTVLFSEPQLQAETPEIDILSGLKDEHNDQPPSQPNRTKEIIIVPDEAPEDIESSKHEKNTTKHGHHTQKGELVSGELETVEDRLQSKEVEDKTKEDQDTKDGDTKKKSKTNISFNDVQEFVADFDDQDFEDLNDNDFEDKDRKTDVDNDGVDVDVKPKHDKHHRVADIELPTDDKTDVSEKDTQDDAKENIKATKIKTHLPQDEINTDAAEESQVLDDKETSKAQIHTDDNLIKPVESEDALLETGDTKKSGVVVGKHSETKHGADDSVKNTRDSLPEKSLDSTRDGKPPHKLEDVNTESEKVTQGHEISDLMENESSKYNAKLDTLSQTHHKLTKQTTVGELDKYPNVESFLRLDKRIDKLVFDEHQAAENQLRESVNKIVMEVIDGQGKDKL